MERSSEWIRPGWFVGACAECEPFPLVEAFQKKQFRDIWAAMHWMETNHVVEKLNGEEL